MNNQLQEGIVALLIVSVQYVVYSVLLHSLCVSPVFYYVRIS